MNTKEGICRSCKRPMHWSANVGAYCCRSDDCPPGTKAKYEADRKLRLELLADLRLRKPSEFATVEDLMRVVLSDGNIDALKQIKKRLVADVEKK